MEDGINEVSESSQFPIQRVTVPGENYRLDRRLSARWKVSGLHHNEVGEKKDDEMQRDHAELRFSGLCLSHSLPSVPFSTDCEHVCIVCHA